MKQQYHPGGVFSLLQSAIDERSDDGFHFLLDGDLNQMGIQERFLRDRGFAVGRRNVYPALKTEEEFNDAIKAIWKSRTSGWWQYRRQLVKNNVCTEEEFKQALDFECDHRR